MRIERPRARRVALTLAAASALVLAGCSTDTEPTDPDPDPGASASPSDDDGDVTTITFWNGFTGPDGGALEDRVAAFNEANPDVVVDMTIMPWDVLSQKLMPALGAHEGPNISVNGVEAVPANALTGAFAPLDEYYERWDEQDLLFDAVADGTLYEGTHYSVPMTFSPMLLYYNKALFAEAGLDPEAPPTTWDELREAALALTKDADGDGTPEQYGFLMPSHNAPMVWENLMWNNGGGTVSADGTTATIGDPESIEAVEQWVDLITSDSISPGGMSGADADALFSAGKGAMLVEGPWMSNGFEEAGIEFGIAPLAAGPAGEYSVANSSMFFVSNDTFEDEAQKEAVWRFFDFWNSQENQAAWAATSGNPPTRADVTAADVADNPYVGEFIENRGANIRFFLANILPVNEVRGIYESTMQKVTTNAGTPSEAMTDAARQIQDLLDK